MNRLPRAIFILHLMLVFLAMSATVSVLASDKASAPVRTSVGLIQLSGMQPDNPIPQCDESTITIPLKRAHNLLLVEGTIDSMRGNFILDFGAPYLVLNATYFRNYRTDYSRVASSVNATGGYAKQTSVGRLDLGDLCFEELDADVTELGNVENQRQVRILGLLGVNLFTEFEVELDLKESVLVLHKLDGNGGRIVADTGRWKWPDLFLPMKIDNNVIFLNGEIGGKKFRFTLDTGAEVNLLDKRISSRALAKLKIRRTAFLNDSDGGRVEVLDGTLTELVLGDQTFRNMRTFVTDLSAMSRGYGAPIQGMLGYPFLIHGIFRLNFKKGELRTLYYKRNAE